MSGRAISGGFDNRPPAPRGIYAPRDLNLPLPSGSILKPFEVSEPPVHKFKAFENALLFFITAAALLVGVFIVLFVET